ncbi:hypothetical protein I79_002477 [Cricetulus griseus]|uniref:Uncharacterized protein n=1 Tax=Cricetulus griseus TaxID=10029 RepID=G3GXI5_CRIGR|nr:hypothetical protein I79_002477 [Cricetulus griseus]
MSTALLKEVFIRRIHMNKLIKKNHREKELRTYMVTSKGKPNIPMMTSSKRKRTFHYYPTTTTKVEVRSSSMLLLSHLLQKITYITTEYDIGIQSDWKTLVQSQ